MLYLRLPITLTFANHDETMNSYPFLAYSAEYWGAHVADAADDEQIRRLSCAFLQYLPAVKLTADIHSIHLRQRRRPDQILCLFKIASPACVAAYFGLSYCLRQIHKTQGPNAISTTCSLRRTPLHYAIASGHFDAVSRLLSWRLPVNSKDICELQPVHLVAWKGDRRVLQRLLDDGANVNATTKGYLAIDYVTNKSRPLHLAAINPVNGTCPVTALLKQGADVKAKDNRGRTAIHHAAQHGRTSIVKVLLDWQADIEAKTDIDETPLIMAATYNHHDTVRVLLDHQARIDIAAVFGETSLGIALCHKNRSIWDMIFPSTDDQNGMEALEYAMTKDLEALGFAMIQDPGNTDRSETFTGLCDIAARY